MKVTGHADAIVGRIAAAIGAPARVRMLYCLVDGRPRTCTELAIIADLTASTATVHLQRLRAQRLVTVVPQGRHRYYSLAGAPVAAALEALSVLAGGSGMPLVPDAASRLRAARTCYDHIAGALGVALCNRFRTMGWLSGRATAGDAEYDLSVAGSKVLGGLGIDLVATRSRRRRFAYACIDWTERQPHLGGALGAALLDIALRRKWVRRDRDSRALAVTAIGLREITTRLGVPTSELTAALGDRA
jgi:DNA-binding transcriptional ArsR family regulator